MAFVRHVCREPVAGCFDSILSWNWPVVAPFALSRQLPVQRRPTQGMSHPSFPARLLMTELARVYKRGGAWPSPAQPRRTMREHSQFQFIGGSRVLRVLLGRSPDLLIPRVCCSPSWKPGRGGQDICPRSGFCPSLLPVSPLEDAEGSLLGGQEKGS